MESNKNIPLDNKEDFPIAQEPGFSTPPSYFDELPIVISDRIHSREKKPFFVLKPSFAIGSLAVLSGLIVLFLFLKNDSLPLETELSENDIAHVVANPELYDIDEDVITEAYLSASFEPAADEFAVPEDQIRNFLDESSDATNIINEY